MEVLIALRCRNTLSAPVPPDVARPEAFQLRRGGVVEPAVAAAPPPPAHLRYLAQQHRPRQPGLERDSAVPPDGELIRPSSVDLVTRSGRRRPHSPWPSCASAGATSRARSGIPDRDPLQPRTPLGAITISSRILLSGKRIECVRQLQIRFGRVLEPQISKSHAQRVRDRLQHRRRERLTVGRDRKRLLPNMFETHM